MEFTILMPCLDEALTIETCIRKARGYLDAKGIDGEILVADNGSTDGSDVRAVAAGARVVRIARKGYGAALIGGIEAAKGRFVIMADADESYDFAHLDDFVGRLRQGFQLVVGNRFAGGILPGAMPFLNRYLGNPVLSFIGRTLFSAPIGDFHCGLRGFDREAILKLKLKSTGMEFASEMVVKASLARLDLAEVPTTLRPDGRDRSPHLRPWRDGWRHLRFMLLRSPQWLFVYPGVSLTSLALPAAAWVTIKPRHILAITLDVNALLYFTTAVIVGVQIVYFGFFAMAVAEKMSLRAPAGLADRLLRWASLHTAIAVGIGLVLLGLSGALYAIVEWGNASFGALVPSRMMRITIPAVTTLAIGMQMLFGTLLLGFIDLER
jgi:glycosyltransferase involved in cell wall biosynthesis